MHLVQNKQEAVVHAIAPGEENLTDTLMRKYSEEEGQNISILLALLLTEALLKTAR